MDGFRDGLKDNFKDGLKDKVGGVLGGWVIVIFIFFMVKSWNLQKKAKKELLT